MSKTGGFAFFPQRWRFGTSASGASISGPSGRIRRPITAPLFGVADCDVRQKNAPTGNVCRGKALMRRHSGTKKGVSVTRPYVPAARISVTGVTSCGGKRREGFAFPYGTTKWTIRAAAIMRIKNPAAPRITVSRMNLLPKGTPVGGSKLRPGFSKPGRNVQFLDRPRCWTPANRCWTPANM